MGLVNVNCPNCGANVQLNDGQNRAFCMFCGGQIQVQEAIKKISIDKSGEIENLLVLVSEDLLASNFDMAQQRVQKALEIDPTNPEAWILNMFAISHSDVCEIVEPDPKWLNLRVDAMPYASMAVDSSLADSIIRCGTNAIKYSNNNIACREIVSLRYLTQCECNLEVAQRNYEDVNYIRARLEQLEDVCYPGQIAHWGEHKHEEIMCNEDAGNLQTIGDWEIAAFTFLRNVEEGIVAYDDVETFYYYDDDDINEKHHYNIDEIKEKYYDNLYNCSILYKNATEALNKRLGLYNCNISNETLRFRQVRLNEIYNMIPQSYRDSKNIANIELHNEKQTETNWGKLILSIILFILMFICMMASEM